MKRSMIVSASMGLMMLAAAVGSTGCSKEPQGTPHSDQALQVAASIEESTPASATASRAMVSTGAWKQTSTFGLWVVPYKITGASAAQDAHGVLRVVNNYADNVKHSYVSGSNFLPDQKIYYPSVDGKVDLYAVSPYPTLTDNTLSSTTAYPHAISTNQSTTDSVVASDLMTGLGSGSVAAGAKVSFRHRMSKAVVAFKLPATYKTHNVQSIKKVELCGVPLKTTVNLIDTTIYPTPTAGQTATHLTAYQAEKPTSGTVAGDYLYEVMVVPGSVIKSGAVMVRITIEVDTEGEVVFTCKLGGADHTFQAGKQTDIQINIEDLTEISLDPSLVTIAAWGTTPNISGSTSKLSKMLFEYVDPSDIYTTCNEATLVIEGETINASSIKWLTGSPRYLVLEYDHQANAGGYLEEITIKKKDGSLTMLNQINLKNANDGTAKGYVIKNDPTQSNYNVPIGKIDVVGLNSVTITRIR